MQTNFFSFSVLRQSIETYEMSQNKRLLLGTEVHWEEAALSSEVLIPIHQTTWLHIPQHCRRNILSYCRCREIVKLFLFLLSPYNLLETWNNSDIYQESQNKRKHLGRIHPYSVCCQKSVLLRKSTLICFCQFLNDQSCGMCVLKIVFYIEPSVLIHSSLKVLLNILRFLWMGERFSEPCLHCKKLFVSKLSCR
jgi:hypothetical protein